MKSSKYAMGKIINNVDKEYDIFKVRKPKKPYFFVKTKNGDVFGGYFKKEYYVNGYLVIDLQNAKKIYDGPEELEDLIDKIIDRITDPKIEKEPTIKQISLINIDSTLIPKEDDLFGAYV